MQTQDRVRALGGHVRNVVRMATSAPTPSPRSLADDLRARDGAQIRTLLTMRPDLLHPLPADLGQLAKRAADDASVLEALQSLTTTELRVLEVFSSLQNATIEEVLEVLPDDDVLIREAVTRLREMALLWGWPQLHPIRCAREAFGAHPCGLAGAGHVSCRRGCHQGCSRCTRRRTA